ncbi:MAG: HAMP domain-containing histidine kinase, partial [Cyanobacteria bacterium REEB65]|nr:HAMP domain-containing histidine kinase [Cyanobacteria bacterium REEB65]
TKHQIAKDCARDFEVDIYPGSFSQILTNLVLNALIHGFDAKGSGGQIVISAKRDGRDAVVTVQDDGIGIAPENQGRIFDPFFTTKRNRGGSGLGLHVVNNLVQESLGGVITCQSNPGEGTTFVVSFPLTSP